jgi:hypothetical protein
MNGLDTQTLRRALRAAQEPGCPSAGLADPTEVAQIITRGRRLRWRRRAVAVGGGVCLAAAVFGAVAGIGRLTAPASGGPAPHVISPVGPSRSTRPTPVPRPSGLGPGRATPSPVPTARAGRPGSATPVAIPSASAASRTVPTPTPTMSVSSSVSPVSSLAPASTPSATASASVSATTVNEQPTATSTSG